MHFKGTMIRFLSFFGARTPHRSIATFEYLLNERLNLPWLRNPLFNEAFLEGATRELFLCLDSTKRSLPLNFSVTLYLAILDEA